MVQLSGILSGEDLPSFVKFLSDRRQTGCLQLATPAWTAEIGFREGCVVAASFGRERGLSAIMALGPVMRDVEFTYLEGEGPGDDELDPVLQQLSLQPEPSSYRHGLSSFDAAPSMAGRLGSGVSAPDANQVASRPESVAVMACPELGFADDPASHFPRPTALHRCFASGTLAPVTTLDQLELCLSDRYSVCPRLRGAPGRGAPPFVSTMAEASAHARIRDTEVPDTGRTTGPPPILPIVSVTLAVAAALAWAIVILLPKFA